MKKQKKSKQQQRSSKKPISGANRVRKSDDIAIGRRTALELVDAGAPVKQIYLREGIEKDDLLRRVLQNAEKRGIRAETLSAREFDNMNPAGLHAAQGILCILAPYDYCEVGDITSSAPTDAAFVVVCDHVTDAGNLGAIIRSADSAGACGVIIPNRRSAQVNASTYKTSAGAVIHQRIACVPNISRALAELKDAGFWIVAATEHAENDIWDCDLKGRIAMVVGNEHDGISDLVLDNCEIYAKLPQRGKVESLNVAQASTVFMYEWMRQNRDAL